MINDANRASTIIAKIRALAKNSAPQIAALDVNDVIQEAVALVQRELDDHGVVLHQDLAAGAANVPGDRIQLQQVIINLVKNSIDAMENVAKREIIIRSSRSENNRIVVEVRNSGAGVDPVEINKLFQPFFTTKSKGLGIGLAISRSIIEGHDGSLTMSSSLAVPPFGLLFRRAECPRPQNDCWYVSPLEGRLDERYTTISGIRRR